MNDKYRVLHVLIKDHLPDNGWLSKEEFDEWLDAFAGVARYIAVGPQEVARVSEAWLKENALWPKGAEGEEVRREKGMSGEDALIFLDIDGVLNTQKPYRNGYCGMSYPCVEAFNFILKQAPEANIVVSSSWRYAVHSGTMTLKGLENLFLTHGIDCFGRIEGITRKDVSPEEPREAQILDYLRHREKKTAAYVVLDDLPLKHVPIVQTDGSRGLTFAQADKATAMLLRRSAEGEDTNERTASRY